ncbi:MULTISPECIES: hypothetical protein [Paenarthrobacter]|jgi:hypothetical protein|uniref:hypothetical protein n=1 Tax=Paenarthrobacter TaxID=1742992 RepID=UPI0018778DF7|nr:MULTISPECIES: hypothetical protein [Paenarthrobacter]MCW3767473.1 hypothetical protein [Paenarthrobacter sp. PAE-2]MEC3852939.1 hypothetical protein [Paenarthrobacter ureafaciens]QOT15413.1 hypothetical protein HMI59_01645 [Paenarthrobacter sp. YJN-5]QQQ62114.1 hypothetical protein JHQ56_18045 [Paenarthrobacter ureafaciens]QSZ52404.1 hypothetical protein AYX19_04925 [Paenarthrobacter ureafaciens]
MNPSEPLSRRSILRLFPAAALSATAVVLSAKEALAKNKPDTPNPHQSQGSTQAAQGHRAIIGML